MEGPPNLGSTISASERPMVARTRLFSTLLVRSRVSTKVPSLNWVLNAELAGRDTAALASWLTGTSEKRADSCGGGSDKLDEDMVVDRS